MRAVASEGQREGPVPLLGFQAAQRSTVTRAQTGAFEHRPVDSAEAAVWSSAMSPRQLPAHVCVSVSEIVLCWDSPLVWLHRLSLIVRATS